MSCSVAIDSSMKLETKSLRKTYDIKTHNLDTKAGIISRYPRHRCYPKLGHTSWCYCKLVGAMLNLIECLGAMINLVKRFGAMINLRCYVKLGRKTTQSGAMLNLVLQ